MKAKGTNIQENKLRNKLLVFKLICTNRNISRKEIADETGLTRMAVGNLVSELIADGLVIEDNSDPSEASNQYGRRPISLKLSSSSPCVCGILIKRGVFHFIVGTLNGQVEKSISYEYDSLKNQTELLDLLYQGYLEVTEDCPRNIVAISIASIGPLNTEQGIILRPPFFYGIHDVHVTEFFEEKTGLPAFLINDASAGALAEILFGSMKNTENFLYLHLMNGIGTGIVINGRLYDGDTGQSGEIGHMSINFAGPRCDCGNKGCLELYANVDNLREYINERKLIYPSSRISRIPAPTWYDIIAEANDQEPLALMALDNYCGYLSVALISSLKLLNLSTIILGYENNGKAYTLETILQGKLSDPVRCNSDAEINIIHSHFGADAPLIGSLALVANKVFRGEFTI